MAFPRVYLLLRRVGFCSVRRPSSRGSKALAPGLKAEARQLRQKKRGLCLARIDEAGLGPRIKFVSGRDTTQRRAVLGTRKQCVCLELTRKAKEALLFARKKTASAVRELRLLP